jgi:hypothetical protein
LAAVASREAADFRGVVGSREAAALVASAVGARVDKGRAASEVSEVAFLAAVALGASEEATRVVAGSAAATKGVAGSAVATIVAGDADQL